jgi:cob(I)alamin adenosyltransferase
MSISTRTGDDGTTGLLFNRRVSKTHPRVAACGAVDEFNAGLGLARATAADAAVAAIILTEQKCLVGLMGELATDDADHQRLLESKLQRLQPADLARLDDLVAAYEARSLHFSGWDTPGATLHHAHLHQARVHCRRAERAVLALREKGMQVSDLVIHYLNRFSDVLWLLACAEENRAFTNRQESSFSFLGRAANSSHLPHASGPGPKIYRQVSLGFQHSCLRWSERIACRRNSMPKIR